MKKLLITATIALAAISLNAATVKWTDWTAASGYLYGGATEGIVTSGSAYLMYVTNAYTQSSLVDDYYAVKGNVGSTVSAMTDSGALATGTGTVSNGRIAATESSSELAGDDGTVYFVVFNDDKMFISTITDAEYDSMTGRSDASFGNMTAASHVDWEQLAAYSGAGWYSVPEPTSGMLLLVGCALMALKRKRA